MNKDIFNQELADILEIDFNDLNAEIELDNNNWNSLSIVAIIALLDEQFYISIDGDKLKNCRNVGELWKLIDQVIENK